MDNEYSDLFVKVFFGIGILVLFILLFFFSYASRAKRDWRKQDQTVQVVTPEPTIVLTAPERKKVPEVHEKPQGYNDPNVVQFDYRRRRIV